MKIETIEMSVALHVLILPPISLQLFPLIYLTKPVRYINFSPHHLNTLENILPASPNSQLSVNRCEIGEDSVSSISPLAFVLTSAKPNTTPPPITQAIRPLA
jgi:hypothetical protein